LNGWGRDGRERDARLRLSATFDRAAGSYHQARPDYPVELYDCLLAAADLTPGDKLLEVGCGTGKATLPLARMGFAITRLEPGPALAGTRFPEPGEVPDECADMEASGLFSVTTVKQFDWAVQYDAGQYIALLDTFSSHIDMAHGSVTASTARSAGGLPKGPTAGCGGTGAQRCK
jgi:SAM-dependent methyltransferase